MKARKRIGPSTLPCGTPDVTAASSEHSPSTAILWDLFFKKFSIKSRHGPLCHSTGAFQGVAFVGSHQKLCWSPAFPLPLPAITYQLVSAVLFCRSTLPWSHIGSPLAGHSLPGVAWLIWLWCSSTLCSKWTSHLQLYKLLLIYDSMKVSIPTVSLIITIA